jgi:hypothetical protein
MSHFVALEEQFEREVHSLHEDGKRFFKLFQESTFEGSGAAARKMKKIAKGQCKYNQKFLLFHSLRFLAHSDSEMLSWPNSSLLVLLHFVYPNVLFGEEDNRVTLLYDLVGLTDPFDYFTHTNQLILAKQLIERGANVNAVSRPHGRMPLQNACYSGYVTNLDFVELLLKKGADPNTQDRLGVTPLMFTLKVAPGAAKALLNWPTTEVNILSRSGESFLVEVRSAITSLSQAITFPDNPEKVQHQFQLQQWREIEEMLVERGAADTTAIE